MKKYMKLSFFKPLMAVMFVLSSLFGMAQNQPGAEQIRKKIEFKLLPEQKPVGEAIDSKNPEVRIVKVDDFQDVYAYMTFMCPQQQIKLEKKGDYHYYTYVLPDGEERLVLSDKADVKKKEIAVLEVEVKNLKGKVRQVRFVKR